MLYPQITYIDFLKFLFIYFIYLFGFVGSNKLGIGKLLLGKGIDIDAQNSDGLGAIHFIVLKGHLRLLEWLLNEQCDVNLQVIYFILFGFSLISCIFSQTSHSRQRKKTTK